MSKTFQLLRGEYECFTASPLDAVAVSGNPLQAAHDAMVRELARMAVPFLPINPIPADFEHAGDYLIRVANIFDLLIEAVGQEVAANALCNVRKDYFKAVVMPLVHDGPAAECLSAANACAEHHEEDLCHERAFVG